jgi:hypothetical protein
MKTTNDGDSVLRHLEEDDLLCYLDGELSRSEQESVRTHLEGCWHCRSRLLAVQNSIESFLRLRKQILPPEIPPSSVAVSQFRRRLSQHASAPTSLRQRLPQWLRPSQWRNLLPDFSLVRTHKKTVLATALGGLVLVAVLIDPLGLSHVSADELLTRASTYESLNELPAGKVVRARVRLDRIALSTHVETKIGEMEMAEDSLTSSIHVIAHHASGTTDKITIPDRDKTTLNFFASDFTPPVANYLTAQSYLPQVTVSAYRRLIAGRGFAENDSASTARRGDIYELHHSFSSAHASGIKETVLSLNAQTYAPEAISIFATDGSEQFEYRLTRTSFEKLERTSEVAQLFEGPKTETTASATVETRNSKSEAAEPKPETANSKPETATATADLEVEVLRLLHQTGADLGEQISVARDPNGPVRVSGIVESDQRKTEILRALQPVAENAAIQIEVKTVAEAMAESGEKRDTSRPTTVEGVEVAADTFPAYEDLRARMSDEEARVFAARMVSRSHSAMRHAWALKRLMAQFSANELATLQPDAHAKWIALIQSHAREFERETAGVRQQLQPIFSSESEGRESSEETIKNDAELMRAAKRLIALASTNYEAMRSAFTVTRESTAVSAIKTPQFWRSLRSAEAVAAKISGQ